MIITLPLALIIFWRYSWLSWAFSLLHSTMQVFMSGELEKGGTSWELKKEPGRLGIDPMISFSNSWISVYLTASVYTLRSCSWDYSQFTSHGSLATLTNIGLGTKILLVRISRILIYYRLLL